MEAFSDLPSCLSFPFVFACCLSPLTTSPAVGVSRILVARRPRGLVAVGGWLIALYWVGWGVGKWVGPEEKGGGGGGGEWTTDMRTYVPHPSIYPNVLPCDVDGRVREQEDDQAWREGGGWVGR